MTLPYRNNKMKGFPHFYHITLGSEQKTRGGAVWTVKKEKIKQPELDQNSQNPQEDAAWSACCLDSHNSYRRDILISFY